jgi:hypothetical protein
VSLPQTTLALTERELTLLAEAVDHVAEHRAKTVEWAEKERHLGRPQPAKEEGARRSLAELETLLARLDALLPPEE